MKITIEVDSLDELRDVLARIRLEPPPLPPGRSIDDLDFSIRTRNCLLAGNITTIDQLLMKSPSDLLRIPNFGRAALVDVRNELKRHGFDWYE